MIDHINSSRCSHVMTVEDPIEFLHRDKRSIVNQREVPIDTRSFAQRSQRPPPGPRRHPGRRNARSRNDRTALIAAETGHLVFSTLHTLDATETINRIIAVYPPHSRSGPAQLAAVLGAVVSQRLIPRADVPGRVPAVEVLVATAFIRDCIIDKEKTHLINGAIAQGTSQAACRRSINRSSACFSKASSHSKKRCGGPRTSTNSSWKVQGISTTADAARDEMSSSVIGAGTLGNSRGSRGSAGKITG